MIDKKKIMIDKKERFVLSLKGHPYKGHMEYWAYTKDCFGWISNKKYSLLTEPWMEGAKISFIENRIVLMHKCHYTLGKQVDYMTLMKIVAEKEKGKYDDPNFTAYKLPEWPD